MTLQILGPGVNHRNRRVGTIAFLQHHVGNRLPDNVGATDNNDLGAAGFHSGPNDHLLNACRRARRKFDFIPSDHQAADIDRVKTVHIFIRIDGIENLFFINMFRQGKLD